MSDRRSALAPAERGQSEAAESLLNRNFNAAAAPVARRHVPTLEEFLAAAREGNPGTIAGMIAAGAPLDGQNDKGETALMIAAGAGKADAVKKLLEKGASSKLRDQSGNTVVQRMIMKSDVTMLQTLVDAKADLETRNRADQTALEFSIMMLTLPGLDKATGMLTHPGMERQEMFDILIKGGANAKAADEDGVTPVMWAAMANSEYALKALVAKGADIHAIAKSGANALTVAANNDSLKAAALLLDAGVATSNIDDKGKTPRQNAEEKGFNGMVTLILATEAKRIVIALTGDRGADTAAPEKATFKKRGGSGGGASGGPA